MNLRRIRRFMNIGPKPIALPYSDPLVMYDDVFSAARRNMLVKFSNSTFKRLQSKFVGEQSKLEVALKKLVYES